MSDLDDVFGITENPERQQQPLTIGDLSEALHSYLVQRGRQCESCGNWVPAPGVFRWESWSVAWLCGSCGWKLIDSTYENITDASFAHRQFIRSLLPGAIEDLRDGKTGVE